MAEYNIKNNSDLMRALKDAGLKQMIEIIGEDVKMLIKAYMEECFYGQYSPKFYQRTFQLLNSVTTSEVREISNGYEVTVYLDIDSIHYDDDGYEEEIVWLASQGFHGSGSIYEQGEFWNEAIQELDSGYIAKKFGEFLSAKGFNVKHKGSMALPK
jgi:hypothetical protein